MLEAVKRKAAQQDLLPQAAWLACEKSPVVFAEEFWKIRHPAERGLIPFKLREPQRVALRNWVSGGNWLTLKARQIGWSTLVAFYACWMAMFREYSEIILISKTQDEAIELLRKVRDGYRELPEWMRKRCPVTVDNQQEMTFANGSQISARPSESDPARGRSASLIVVDEWASLNKQEEAWASIKPVADIGGQIIGLSTAKGMGNHFFELWTAAQAGLNSFGTMFYGWDAVPERDEEWYETQKRDLLEWQLHQEFPRNAEEAFVKSGRPVFDTDKISAWQTKEPRWRGETADDDPHWREYAESGSVRVWEFPDSQKAYVIGADVAEGLAHGDASSAHVLKAETGELVATYHGRPHADIFGDELFKLGKLYNTALLCVENNHHGLTTITQLRHLGYKRLFRTRERSDTIRHGQTIKYGFKTTKSSKAYLIDQLVASIRDDELGVWCADTIRELRAYQLDDNGRMFGAPHDDRVMSLALANYMLQFAYQPEYADPVDDTWTQDWFARLAKTHASSTPSWTIGKDNVRAA